MSTNGTHNPGYTDQAKLDSAAAKAFEENQRSVASAVKIKNGKLFGLLTVPPEMERSVNTILGPLTAWLSKSASGFVYNQTKAIAEGKLFERHLPSVAGKASKIAMFAELGTMWGILAFRPISEFIATNHQYTLDRLHLSRDIRSACEATGADAHHNEVVRAAYNGLHDGWVGDLKMMIPGLLVLAAQAPYGMKLQDKILKNREGEIDLAKLSAEVGKANPTDTPAQIKAKAAVAQQRAVAEEHKAMRATFFEVNDDFKPNTTEGEEQFKRFMERNPRATSATAVQDAHAPNAAMGDLMTFGGLSGIAGMLGQDVEKAMQKSADGKGKIHSSYDLIVKLKEQMQAGNNKQSVHKAVVEIFQQLEEDMHRTKFAGGLLEKLEDLTKPIAEAIGNGTLDPLALVKLAGEHQVIEHGTGGKRAFRSEEAIEKSLQELLGCQIRKEHEVSAETFLGTFANQLLAKETIKKNLAELKGEERDFFISILPMELLVDAGLAEAEICERRQAAHGQLYDQVASAVIHIAAQNEEMLKEHGMSAKDVAALKQLSKKILAGDEEAVKMAVDGKEKQIIANIAAVELSEQIAGNQAVWTERVKESKSLEERIATIKSGKDDGANEPAKVKGMDEKHRGIEPRSLKEHAKSGKMDPAQFQQGV